MLYHQGFCQIQNLALVATYEVVSYSVSLVFKVLQLKLVCLTFYL
jgi:hypothetical protein